ncbi:MAG: hypothetical protein B6I38_06250 [Anaerolineaceae bacterium 4572_5.1]|nr:MAG: hypothetical protein B6I38_06250 [Anaerolineaceae bacterium 4572_5.1]
MRIGMMTDTYKPYISGITNYIALNKRYLEKAGHEVYIFTFGNLDYQDDETNIIRSPGKALVDTGFFLSYRYSREAKKLLQTMDIVHVHHPLLSGLLALRYCRPHKIPILFTNHTRYDLYAQAYMPLLPEIISASMLKTYMPPYCEAVDRVVSPSPGMAKILRQLEVESHIEVIPNGVELQRFHQAAPLSRSKFGFSPDDILLVYTGRLAPEKNLDFLLKAFEGVAETLAKAHLLLIGGGISQEKIEKQAAQSAAAERIHFVGRVDYDKMPGYLRMCDAFVTASISEVHPLSVIEAMGAGLPVLGIHSPGVGDTVEDGITGFLSTENLPAFTAKMTRLCIENDLREKMGAAASEASALYAVTRTTKMMIALYENIIENAPPYDDEHDLSLRKIVERILP